MAYGGTELTQAYTAVHKEREGYVGVKDIVSDGEESDVPEEGQGGAGDVVGFVAPLAAGGLEANPGWLRRIPTVEIEEVIPNEHEENGKRRETPSEVFGAGKVNEGHNNERVEDHRKHPIVV